MLRIESQQVDTIVKRLQEQGYCVIAPTVRNGAIIYDEIQSASELPVGWTELQSAASYKLERRRDQAMFGFAVGPQSWKKFLLPPLQKILTAHRENGSFVVEDETQKTDDPSERRKLAFLGVRSCELHAITIQDKVFLSQSYEDPHYKKIRENIFIVAVHCGKAAPTCFCSSVNTGPRAESGFDLALTEVLDGQEHYFTVEVGSNPGLEILNTLPQRTANEKEEEQAKQVVEATRRSINKRLDTDGLKEFLYQNTKHPQWDNVAQRCLTCANCTMVCPTCFCTTVEDTTDLTGGTAERWRKWDSCFSVDFSYVHGGSVRATPKSRYRQWLTHKLASWVDQFGTIGCVGCGRCITWCPVGIDLTEEVRAMRDVRVPSRES